MELVQEAAKVLADGGLVAFPTETVYGLGANALDKEAVKKVYAAKGRPSDNPMIVHIARASDIGMLTPMLTPTIIKLADNFWPGPLTMVLEKKETVPSETTGGLDTVAIRLPDHPAAIELIRLAGVPVAAPSANLSGSPSPTRAQDVIADLDGRVDVILAGADSRVGIESTVVDMTVSPPEILRPGVLTAEMIAAAINSNVVYDETLTATESSRAPRSPGMKYRHYAPKAEMIVIEGQRDKVGSEIARLKAVNERLGSKVGVLLFEEKAYVEAAHDFYARLRDLDEGGADLILAGALSDKDGVGFAVMNRMMKSAGHKVAKV
ncbi:MAG: threonylcarbamoyl-AMP synthase [Clostridiales Family XIII bacterium]|jgi:L-threonylcarbamoyladenylate synthase|nr:threonylcarbamoyl-AMP synthase [Clostridiales Family XIII bacterium]